MTVVSCSCDVFIRPGRHGFSWPTTVLAHAKPQKNRPNSKISWRYGHCRPKCEAVFGSWYFFWDPGNRNRRNHMIIWTSQTPYCSTLYPEPLPYYSALNYCTVRSLPWQLYYYCCVPYYSTTAILLFTLVYYCTELSWCTVLYCRVPGTAVLLLYVLLVLHGSVLY